MEKLKMNLKRSKRIWEKEKTYLRKKIEEWVG